MARVYPAVQPTHPTLARPPPRNTQHHQPRPVSPYDPVTPSKPRTNAARMIEFGHLTHVGLRRELNEDTYYGDSELGLWLVADGMGGHEYGEVASALAREAIVREVRAGKHARGGDPHRGRGNHQVARKPPRRQRCRWAPPMVAAVRVNGNRFEVAWVGDSRVYLWRDGALTSDLAGSQLRAGTDRPGRDHRTTRRAATRIATW
jgi:hypothetical protein